MAGMTGILGADFTSFLNAVAKAEVSLKSFETGASKVEKSLTTMGNAFSGQKIISDATLMTKAVENAGGAATLTAKEMARVNSTVTEAIAKYTALGQVAPKSMTDLATATTKTDDASGGFMGSLSKMGGLLSALGVGLSVGAVVNFGKALVSDADALVKLHDKTAISLQDLQRLQIVGDDTGVSLDAMAMAVNRLQKNIGSDNEGASQALRTLGLKMEDIRAMSPENQFYEISKALAAVKDPAEQVAIGTALMGKGFTEVLPAIKAGFEDVRKASVGMSDDTVRNLDSVGDAFSKMWRTTKGVVANLLVDVFNPTIKGFREAAASMVALKEATDKLAPPLAKVMPYEVIVDVKEFDRAMESSSKTISEATAKTKAQNAALDAVNQKIRDATRDVGKLTTAQEASVKQYKALGLSTEEVALKMGVSAGAVTRYEAETKKAEDAAKKFNDELAKNTDAAHKNESGLAGLHATLGVLTTTELDAVKATLAAYDAFEKLTDKIDDIEQAAHIANFGFKGMADELEKLGTKSTELDDVQTHLENAKTATGGWSASLSTLSKDFVDMAQIGGDSFSELGRVIGTIVKAFDMARTAMSSFEKASKSAAGATTADYAAMAASVVGAGFAIGAMIAQYKNAQADARRLAAEQAILNDIQAEWNTTIQLTTRVLQNQRTEWSQMSAIIEELGGVTKLTTDQYTHLAEELQRAIVGLSLADEAFLKTASAKDMVELLNRTVAEMGRAALKSGGLVNQTFLDLIKNAKAFGVTIEGVNELVLEQLGGAAEGLNELLAGLSKGLGDSFRVTQEQGAGLAASIAGTFAEMIERGASFKEALDALGPSIDILTEALKTSGVDGGDAFNFLTEMARIANDAIMGPLTEAITGANKALKGLHNSGILNQEMFTGLSKSALEAYNRIIDGGADANAAMLLMQPTLQTLWSLQKDFGYEVDAATQALIDEAVATGKVGDKHRPIAEQMLLATQAIEKAVTALAKAMGADLPASAERGAQGVQAAFDKVHVDAPWKDWGPPPTATGSSGVSANFAATGGLVTPSGIQHFAGGGSVLNFRTRGSDTVPAMLTPGEMVLTPAQQARLLRGGGTDNAAVVAAVQQLRADLRDQRRDLPRALGLAVSSAVVLNRKAS